MQHMKLTFYKNAKIKPTPSASCHPGSHHVGPAKKEQCSDINVIQSSSRILETWEPEMPPQISFKCLNAKQGVALAA